MKRLKLIIIPLLMIPIILLTGCLPGESYDSNVRIIDTTGNANGVDTTGGSLDVNITGGSVTAVVATPMPIIQSVTADTNNSSVANVNAGDSFTGTSTSTLGVAGIQVSLKTDRDCMVYIQQSATNGLTPNWDLSDPYPYIASLGGASWTVQAVSSYVRVVVTNTTASNTTYFRLQTALCPIVEALPRSLDEEGRLKVGTTITDNYGFDVEDTPLGEMRVISPVKLVGSTFIGTTVDSNFWTVNSANGGTTTQSGGMLTIQTNTTANGASAITSVRRGRYITGTTMRYRSVLQLSAGATDNMRRWGLADWTTLPTITDGAYFELNGTTLSVVTMKASNPTRISSGSFNGLYGTTYSITANAVTAYEIYWAGSMVYFVVNGKILHTVTPTSATWTSTPTLYIWNDNVNSNNLDTNHTMGLWSASIYRLGELQSAPIYKHITTAATTICKYGAGTLHSVIVGTPANQTITIYDNITNAAPVMSVITLGNNTVPFELHFDMDFYTGLTIVNSGTVDVTCVYE